MLSKSEEFLIMVPLEETIKWHSVKTLNGSLVLCENVQCTSPQKYICQLIQHFARIPLSLVLEFFMGFKT